MQHTERRGLPGGPNEMFTYTTGVFSTEGFRMDSPDVNNYQNIIPSGSITMKERDGSPLRKGPIHGVDNLGNAQVMYPGFDYQFPGTEVTETLMAKMGGALLDKTIKCGNCGWQWKAADGGSDVMDCHKCGGKGLIKAQVGTETKPLGAGKYNTTTGKVVDWGTPEYETAYNRGEVLSDKGVPSEVTMQGGTLDEVVIKNNYKRGFLEKYRDKIVEENKDAGLLGAIIGTPLSAITSLPQLAATYAITGKVERPSEAMDIQNPYGAMAVDAIADPSNWIGVGELTAAGRLTKAEALAKLAKIPTSIAPELRQGLRTAGPSFGSSIESTTTISKNLEDLTHAKDWAKQYGYDLPENLERIAQSDELTNRTIRGMMDRHNTFVRGVSTNWDELAQRNPEILRHLEGKGFDLSTKEGTKQAAEYMATHVPIDTGYGRASLNNQVFDRGQDAIYTSNSIPTAEGYTYGQGYITKVKKPTDFSSSNRQDWITQNNPEYYKNVLPKTRNYSVRDLDNLTNEKIDDLFSQNRINETDKEKILKYFDESKKIKKDLMESYKINESTPDNIIDSYIDDLSKAKENLSKDLFYEDYGNKILRTEKRNLDDATFADNWQQIYNKFPEAKEKFREFIKENNLTSKILNSSEADPWFRKFAAENNYLSNDNPYAHYLHIGTPGEKILEPIKSWEITPDIWENKSRAHTNTYTKKLSALKEGAELTEYQTKGEVKIDLKHSQDIYNQIRPSEYTSLSNYGRYLFGITRGEDEYDDARSEEAFKQYLGLNTKPKYLSVSEYVPSIKGEGKKGSYYKVDSQLEQDIFNSYKDKLKLNQVLPTSEYNIKSEFPIGTPMTSDGYVKLDPYDESLIVGRPMASRARMLGNFNVSKGKDEKGEYMSYSDQYDFPDTMQSKMKGKPYKIYNRIYYNDMKEEGGEPVVQTETVSPIESNPVTQYVVKKGDTLSKIAAANNTSVRSIMKNNEGIVDPNIISINQKINLATQSADAPGEQVYRDWDTIRNKKDQINKLSDEQKIIRYYNDKPEEKYLIVDKKNAVMKLYTGGNFTKSFEVGIGQNAGDAQTVTKVKDGKTDWTAGNKSTGAGIYTISNIDPASKEYYNLPAFNLKNENGIEVATTIHGTPLSRRKKFSNGTVVDNRMSNGCINGKCEDLKDLYNELDVDAKVYVLPEDTGNNFQIIDGKPALRVSAQNRQKYNSYVDQSGTKQKGQGANQTTNTLVYKPIKASLDEVKFKENVFQWNDFNDEKEYTNTTKPFITALTTGKKDVMKAAKISSDVYNELAKMSFGIYGTESNFGDTHSAIGNVARATNKVLDAKSSSSPDYKAKATTYGADEDYRSVGLTQLRWNYLNKDEKNALKEVGITSNKDFLDPKKAAVGTVTVLGVRYNQQLNDKQKQDIWKYLPTKWNNRANYSDRVKSNSSYLSFKQLDKKEIGGESKPGPLMQAYNTMQKKTEVTIANKKQFGGQLNSGNITMYKDYIKGNIGNEIEAVKNYDKLNRIYYSKAKELGMTAANYVMTYVVGNS